MLVSREFRRVASRSIQSVKILMLLLFRDHHQVRTRGYCICNIPLIHDRTAVLSLTRGKCGEGMEDCDDDMTYRCGRIRQ